MQSGASLTESISCPPSAFVARTTLRAMRTLSFSTVHEHAPSSKKMSHDVQRHANPPGQQDPVLGQPVIGETHALFSGMTHVSPYVSATSTHASGWLSAPSLEAPGCSALIDARPRIGGRRTWAVDVASTGRNHGDESELQ